MNKYPKISIVTPVYNGGEFLEECIKSIMEQEYANYEHIIIDGGSSDNTLEIISRYNGKYPMRWISESDKGMYDAITKGFSLATGDILAWLNSDDVYMPHAFDTVVKVMSNSNIEWCTGVPLTFTKDKHIISIPKIIPIYFDGLLKRGYCDGRIYSVVQQESTFWTKRLWEKAGGLNTQYQYAGDYWLWVSFSRFSSLYTLDTVLAGFRVHEGQKSSAINKYYKEIGKLGVLKQIYRKTKIVKLIAYIRTIKRQKQFVKVEKYLNSNRI